MAVAIVIVPMVAMADLYDHLRVSLRNGTS
jgi:hypothetical protein